MRGVSGRHGSARPGRAAIGATLHGVSGITGALYEQRQTSSSSA